MEDCLSIDSNRWMREGLLKAGVHLAGGWRWTYRSGRGFTANYEVDTRDLACPFVRLWYAWARTPSQPEGSADYRIGLATTRPRFGGLRWWFVCPLTGNGWPCYRRVGKLYWPPQGRYFGCRHCYGLTYASCQESHQYDSLYRHMARSMGWSFEATKEVMASIGKQRS